MEGVLCKKLFSIFAVEDSTNMPLKKTAKPTENVYDLICNVRITFCDYFFTGSFEWYRLKKELPEIVANPAVRIGRVLCLNYELLRTRKVKYYAI